MRIGIDCRTILNPGSGEHAGVGHYTHYLVQHLLDLDITNQYVLFFDARMRSIQSFNRPNAVARYFPFSQYRKWLPFAYSHLLISAALNKEGLDLFHAPANIIPLGYTKASVVTVHDLAIYQNPAWFPSQVLSTRLLVPKSLSRARAIIAVSQSTAKDLRELFSIPKSKIFVVPEGVDVTRLPLKDRDVDVRQKFKLPGRYLLFVGTLEPRKNLIRLVQAYHYLRERDERCRAIPLVLAGAKGWKPDALFATIKNLKLEGFVRYLGYVTMNEKLNLISHAAAFVFPSEYEGFGLPVLEAMALGAPVLTSNVSSLPEVAGSAAVLIDPEDTEAIYRGLKRVLFDETLRRRLKQAGPKQAQQFTWQKAARQTLAVYEQAARKLKRE